MHIIYFKPQNFILGLIFKIRFLFVWYYRNIIGIQAPMLCLVNFIQFTVKYTQLNIIYFLLANVKNCLKTKNNISLIILKPTTSHLFSAWSPKKTELFYLGGFVIKTNNNKTNNKNIVLEGCVVNEHAKKYRRK